MCRVLLVRDHDLPDILGVIKRIIKRQNHAARIAENEIRLLLTQAFEDGLRSFH